MGDELDFKSNDAYASIWTISRVDSKSGLKCRTCGVTARVLDISVNSEYGCSVCIGCLAGVAGEPSVVNGTRLEQGGSVGCEVSPLANNAAVQGLMKQLHDALELAGMLETSDDACSCDPPSNFCTPRHLAEWQQAASKLSEEDVSHVKSKCFWCGVKVRKNYHESACPVRRSALDLATEKRPNHG